MYKINLLLITFAFIKVTSGTNTTTDILFHNYWEFVLSSFPELATYVGDNRYNDKLKDYSLSALESEIQQLIQFQSQAEELLKAGSNDEANLKFLISEIKYKLQLYNANTHLTPVSYLDGPPNAYIQLIDAVPITSEKDFHDLVSRYNAIPKQIDQYIDLMKEGVRTGIVHHERAMKNYEKTTASFISVPPEQSLFYEPFKKLAKFLPPEERERQLTIAAETISHTLYPALQKLSDYIKNDYRLHLRKDIAFSSLPNGHKNYEAVLNFYTTADVTPGEIHHLGIKEVKRITEEMDAIVRSLGFEGSVKEFNEKLRLNSSMYFSSSDEALNTYTDFIRNKVEPKLLHFFSKIPKAKLEIRKVPEELAGGPMAYYLPSVPGENSTGIFFLDTSNLKALPIYETATLALHEGEPGHHFQMSYLNELDDVPLFRKRSQYPLYAAFAEGWGLYSEYLGVEMKLYESQLMLYGHLSEEIFRACRLVVDTGMHALGWSRQDAIDYMLKYTASSEANIQNEVDRYITWPGQACSYKYGEITIKENREKAEKFLGHKFDVKKFHDVVLSSSGSMSFLRQEIDNYMMRTP